MENKTKLTEFEANELLSELLFPNEEVETSRIDLLASVVLRKHFTPKRIKKYLLITFLSGVIAYGVNTGCRWVETNSSQNIIEPKSKNELISYWDSYLLNGIPKNVNQSPLTLLLKNDYSFLKDGENDYLFDTTDEEISVINTTSNYYELRNILRLSDSRLKLQKLVEYLQVETLEDSNGNPRYNSNIEDGACNLYITDVLDLLFYGRNDDLISYRTDLVGNPITDPVEILKIDQGIREDFLYNNANQLLINSERAVNEGKMIDATNFSYEDHIEYLKNGYGFIVFLVNENDNTASHSMIEFGVLNEDGSIVPARTQATRNVLASEVTPDSVIFNGDDSDHFGKRYPRVFAFKIPN